MPSNWLNNRTTSFSMSLFLFRVFYLGKGSLLRISQCRNSKRTSKKSSKHQNIESVFLVHYYYDNQNVKKNIKIKTFDVLILPIALKKIRTSKIENINYLWRIPYGCQGLWGVRSGSIRLGWVRLGWLRLG